MTHPVDAYCSLAGYADHLRPVLQALPDDRRGHLYADRNLRRELPDAILNGYAPNSDAPLLVAGFQDLVKSTRPKVFVSHGAGQTYAGLDSASYDGGPGRDMAGLFLCPNERSLQRNLDRYPGASGCAVGCPKVDRWMDVPGPGDGTIAVTFHWPCTAAPPESGWAFQSWRGLIGELAKVRRVVGHGHPRARYLLENYWAAIGVEAVWDPEELLGRADVLIFDNTSLGYEWAAAGRPVVAINDADWRPEIRHGLRFWDQIPGPNVWPRDGLDGLLEAVDKAGMDEWGDRRREVAEGVYGALDGRASERAAAAVLGWEAAGCPHRVAYGTPAPCGKC